MELWEMARAGDDDAFRALADDLWPVVYRVAYRYLGDAGEAEDVAQEALTQAWARLHTFRGQSRFSTWVLAIALNLARSAARKPRPRLAAELETPRETGPSAEDAFFAREEAARLEQALMALPPLWRAAIECVAVQGLSYSEAAKVLSVPVSTLRNWIHRARIRLREAWGDSRPAARPPVLPEIREVEA
jgi:RNA polymerase sigma-70 factor (ECF subfamily)